MSKRKRYSAWNLVGIATVSSVVLPMCHDFDGAAHSLSSGGKATGGHGGSSGAADDGAGAQSSGTHGGTADGETSGAGGEQAGDAGTRGEGARDGSSGKASVGAVGGGGRAGKGSRGGSSGSAGIGGNAGSSAGTVGAQGHAGDSDEPATPLPGPPSFLGAIRLLRDGVPVCGGSLMTNSWILTADQCAPIGTSLQTLMAGFGSDSTNFEQTRHVVEVQRYPGNDSAEPGHFRDLVLLGVEQPFEIDGSATSHWGTLLYDGGDGLYWTHLCAGWDMTPDAASPTNLLRSVELRTVEVNDQPGGKAVWWQNTNLFDVEHGILPTGSDVGVGCFRPTGMTNLLTVVQSANPARRRDGELNRDEEAYAIGASEQATHDWIEQTLVEVDTETTAPLGGTAAVCSFGGTSLELFSRAADGGIDWQHSDGLGWTAAPSIPAPGDAVLSMDRPGVLCRANGDVELLVRTETDGVHWQRWSAADHFWWPDWAVVPNAVATAGLSVVGLEPGHFDAFTRGALGELRHAAYANGWPAEWEDLGGAMVGAPVAREPHPEQIDVFIEDIDNGGIYQRPLVYGNWWNWGWVGGSSAAGPAVTNWGYRRLDLFFRAEASKLSHVWYDSGWGPWLDPNIDLPEGELTAVARGPGSYDLFVSKPGAPLWHLHSPRAPRQQ